MTADLLPCPWCGSADVKQKIGYIRCYNCNAEGPYDHESDWEPEAVAASWNTRHPATKPPEGEPVRPTAMEDKYAWISAAHKRMDWCDAEIARLRAGNAGAEDAFAREVAEMIFDNFEDASREGCDHMVKRSIIEPIIAAVREGRK